jgi:hypothetical protein
MIIDAHQHVVAGPELGNYQSGLYQSRGSQDRSRHGITREAVAQARQRGKRHSELLDEVGTNMAFISPRP